MLRRSPTMLSKIAKWRRGPFRGDVREFLSLLDEEGIRYVFADLLSVVRRIERRGGRGRISQKALGYPAEKVVGIFEQLIYARIKESPAWIYLVSQ